MEMVGELLAAAGEGVDQVELAGRQRTRPVLAPGHLGELRRRGQLGELVRQGDEGHYRARPIAELLGKRPRRIAGGREGREGHCRGRRR